MNHALLSGSLMDESGFGGCWEIATYWNTNSKVQWRRDIVLELFFRVWASSSDGIATAHKDILGHYVALSCSSMILPLLMNSGP